MYRRVLSAVQSRDNREMNKTCELLSELTHVLKQLQKKGGLLVKCTNGVLALQTIDSYRNQTQNVDY